MTVLKTDTNVPAMKALLNCAVNTLTDGQYSHIGSECLWNKHRATVSKTVAKLEKYQLKQVHVLIDIHISQYIENYTRFWDLKELSLL